MEAGRENRLHHGPGIFLLSHHSTEREPMKRTLGETTQVTQEARQGTSMDDRESR